MSKMSLTEATMLALQGKLVEEKTTKLPRKKSMKKENIDINVDDKTNVSVLGNETIVDTEDATIIVDKKEDEFIPETSDGIIDDTTLPVEAPVDTVEIPVEGNETIIPEEVIDDEEIVEEPEESTEIVDDTSIIKPSEENAIEDIENEDEEEKKENKEVEKKEFKFESKKLQEEISDEVQNCAEIIAKEIEEQGCMNFMDIQQRVMELLNIDFETMPDDIYDIFTSVYSALNYLGIDNNFGDGDFYTEKYAKEHPEVLEENKKLNEEVEIEISNDGKEIEVTTDEGEIVETKDETPDDVERPTIETEIEKPIEENKKLNEDYSAAPFRDLMYDCMKDDIEPADVMADRMLSAWSDDDCKWYCETYELVEPYNDFKDENHYYKDLYGNIRDISGQIVEDDLNESKSKKAISVKKIEARLSKKYETKVDKKVENKETNAIETKKNYVCESKSFITKLGKLYKTENVSDVSIKTMKSGLLILEAKINDKVTRFIMRETKSTNNFKRFTLQETYSLKKENKESLNEVLHMLLNKNEHNELECKYINKIKKGV